MSDDDLLFHVDGEVVPAPEATVAVRDRGFTAGDAVRETLRVYGGTPFRWGAHVDRLRGSCSALRLDHGLPDAALRERVEETLAANDLADAAVSLSVTRGTGSGSLGPEELDPVPDADPTVVVRVAPLPRGGVDGDRVWDGPATLRTVETRRIPDAALPSHAATHNRLNAVLARRELRGTDADEALVLDPDGRVTGGAATNLFLVDGDGVATPSLDGPVAPGATRRTALALAREEGLPVRETELTLQDVRHADEAFLTDAVWEVRPVDAVDGGRVGGGPVTELLSRLFDRRVEQECY